MIWISESITLRRLWRVVGDIWGMGRPSPAYAQRFPARCVLYQVVRDHFETFRAEAAAAHERGLPRFVEEEFRGFLRCGSLAGGFARFRCDRCGFDRLVPFSCKGRAVCPRINLLLYYGVLGARSAWRARLRASEPEPSSGAPRAAPDEGSRTDVATRTRGNWLWAELMRRSFGFDVLACPRCGDRLSLVALIEDPRVIRRILSHLGLPTEVPEPRLARSPPLRAESVDPTYDDDVAVP